MYFSVRHCDIFSRYFLYVSLNTLIILHLNYNTFLVSISLDVNYNFYKTRITIISSTIENKIFPIGTYLHIYIIQYAKLFFRLK